MNAPMLVAEAAPNCTTTMTTSTVIEGDYHTMECIIYFRASPGVAPMMTWTGPEPFLKTQSVTNTSVWSGMNFVVSRSMDSESFQCLTNFTSEGFNSPNSADNIPTYSSLYRSMQILVQCRYFVIQVCVCLLYRYVYLFSIVWSSSFFFTRHFSQFAITIFR